MHTDGRPAGLGISREPVGAGVWLFVIQGEVDLASADRVRDELTAIASDGGRTIVVDLARCTFMDSSGLRALLEARRELAGPDGKPGVVIAAPGEQPRKILEMTAVETVMPIFETREAAQAAAGGRTQDGAGPASP